MKKKIIYGLLFAVAMVTASSSFVSCKDYEGDDYAELKEENLTLRDALQTQINGMVKHSDYVTDSLKHYQWNLAIQQSVQALQNDSIKKYAKQIQDNNKLITSIGDTLHQFVFLWGDNLTEILELAGKTVEITKSYSTDTVLWNKAALVADSAWNYVNKGLAVDKDGNTHEDLQSWVKYFESADSALQEQIDSLKQEIDNIKGTLKKQITGIIVQGTYNPVFGTLAVPFGVQSNVLATFVGEAAQDVEFPTTDESMYVGGEYSWISTKEWNAIKKSIGGTMPNEDITQGTKFISTADDNAGELYLTINPSNVDFEGTDFTLRTSDNKVSKVQLKAIEKSNKQLTHGYTRTAIDGNSANGFYVAKAYIDADDAASLAPNFNMKSIASSVKQTIVDAKDAVKNDGSKRQVVTDLANLAATAYANANDVLPRLGVQANWIDEVTGAKSVVSEYNIAATAIKPLGFDVFQNIDGYGTIRNPFHLKYIDGRAVDQEIWDMITTNLALELNLNLPTIPNLNIALDPTTGNYFLPLDIVVDEFYNDENWRRDPSTGYYYYYDSANGVTYVFDGDWYYVQTITGGSANPLLWSQNNGTSWGRFTNLEFAQGSFGTLYVDMTPFVNELFSQFNTQFSNQLYTFNTQLADFNTIGDQLQTQIDDAMQNMGINLAVQVSDMANDYVGKVNKWISRLNNATDAAVSYLNRADRLLQPVLLSIGANNQMAFISRSELAPSTVSLAKGNTVYLQPTTWTLETVTPAYKKYVAVSNVLKDGKSAVNGDAELEAAMAKVNKAIGADKTLEGVHAFTQLVVDDTMKGMTFEIVYTALGYNGVISGTKAYIKVTE